MISRLERWPGRTAVAIFARAPGSRAAKTRLRRDLGGARADAIHRGLVSRCLELRWSSDPGTDWYVFVDEPAGLSWYSHNAVGWEIRVQAAGSLGTRLENAFATLFEREYAKVIVVGSDIPELRGRHLSMANRLLQEHSVVIGPCLDGGYYLLGQRTPGGRLFSGIEWGGTEVYRDTLRLADEAGLDVAALPVLCDIDTGDDWRAFLMRVAQGPAARNRAESRSMVGPPEKIPE